MKLFTQNEIPTFNSFLYKLYLLIKKFIYIQRKDEKNL